VLLDSLSRLRPGVTEIYLHPVADGPELRAYDKAAADIRAGDHVNLLDDELRAILEDRAVRLISYRPLRDLQRGLVHA
jgi:hypothetical protein